MAYYANEAGRRKATEFGNWVAKIVSGGGNSIAALAITAYSITSNVATFTVANTGQLVVGQSALLSGFPTATFFNASTVTIATIPSATTFTVAFTHANASATEAGSIAISQSITLVSQFVELSDGMVYNPFATNASLTIGSGSNQQTITPTTVTVNANGQAVITAPFANLFGQNDRVVSGTFGLQEAINYCVANKGIVEVGAGFAGTTSTITSAAFQGITVEDVRGGANAGVQYFTGTGNSPVSAASAVNTVQVTLTSAQLLALQTTAVSIVPAPGAGFANVPLKMAAQFKINTTAYTIANSDNNFSLEYAAQTTSLMSTLATGLVNQTTNHFSFVGPVTPITGLAQTVAANLGIEVKLIGTSPALTVGDGTLVLTVEFVTIPLL